MITTNKRIGKRVLGIILSMVLAVTLLPLSVQSSYADDAPEPYVSIQSLLESSTSDGKFSTYSNSITPVFIVTNLKLTSSNVKMVSSNPAVLKIKESAFYLARKKKGSHDNIYVAAMYLKSGAKAGVSTISVTVTHPSIDNGYQEWSNKITVKDVVGSIELLTTQSTHPTILGSSGLVNHIANIAPGKSMTLKPYVNNNNPDRIQLNDLEGWIDNNELSFDNVAPIPAKKIKWVKKSWGKAGDAKYYGLTKKGKVTAKKTKKGVGEICIVATYKKVESRNYYIDRQPGKDSNVRFIDQEKPARSLLLRGETRISSASYGPVLALSESSKKFKWSSSNKKVASVNSLGVIKAKKLGKFKVTVKLGKKKSSLTYRVVTLKTLMKKYYKFIDTDDITHYFYEYNCKKDAALINRWFEY
jgi:hypothetical protein